MLMRLILALAKGAMSLGGTRDPVTDSCLHYEPFIVQLRGTLEVRVTFGPPNFGENPAIDSRLHVPLLRLQEPISTCASPTSAENMDAFDNVKFVQLVFPDSVELPRRGATIVVVGSLFQAQLGGQVTKVLMDVRSIRIIPLARRTIG